MHSKIVACWKTLFQGTFKKSLNLNSKKWTKIFKKIQLSNFLPRKLTQPNTELLNESSKLKVVGSNPIKTFERGFTQFFCYFNNFLFLLVLFKINYRFYQKYWKFKINLKSIKNYSWNDDSILFKIFLSIFLWFRVWFQFFSCLSLRMSEVKILVWRFVTKPCRKIGICRVFVTKGKGGEV
jgi:hypothetical protein